MGGIGFALPVIPQKRTLRSFNLDFATNIIMRAGNTVVWFCMCLRTLNSNFTVFQTVYVKGRLVHRSYICIYILSGFVVLKIVTIIVISAATFYNVVGNAGC
jgi:hypothetical protein